MTNQSEAHMALFFCVTYICSLKSQILVVIVWTGIQGAELELKKILPEVHWGYESLNLLTASTFPSFFFLSWRNIVLVSKGRSNAQQCNKKIPFLSSLHLCHLKGKWILFIHSWVNYLSLSRTVTGIMFETEKPYKCGNDRSRQTRPCLIARLPFVISQCVWSLQ